MPNEMDLDVLAESFSELLQEEWPREKAVAYADSGNILAEDLWGMMAGLGWTAITAPESAGGLGLGHEALVRLHAALGAAVVPAPMLGTTVAIALLTAAGTEAQKARWLPGLADGSVRVAIAQPGDSPLTADGATIDGTVRDLPDAPGATLLILDATRNGAPCWLLIPADAPGVVVERIPLMDTTRTLGNVVLTNVAPDEDVILSAVDHGAVRDRLLQTGCLALAADALGGGQAVLALTIEYMKVREQFGRVIGSFQALKHRVADHQTALTGSRALLDHAASLPETHPEALLYAISAKAHITRIVADIARDCIQLHGGVGFTAEFPPHLYLKRAKLNEALYGTQVALLDRVADILEAA